MCRLLVPLLLVGALLTCIDPYNPELDKLESFLVVDALLTDENISNYVRLTRTIKDPEERPAMVSDATVMIKDDLGKSTELYETSEGTYMTDSLEFRGETGRSYTLYIKTAEGEEYESEECLMSPVQDIDSIYFAKDREVIDNEIREGIRIYIDTKGESEKKYYRWTFEEWWKIRVPYVKMFDYIRQDSIIECSQIREVCWGNKKSYEINIKSSETRFSQPVLFVASEKSGRLLIQYYIKVKQLSISKKEYEFWDLMQQIEERGGDIFEKQPFQISGNIHNIGKPAEQVLGYFQVSGVKVKERYITYKEINDLGIPFYEYKCDQILKGTDDYPVAYHGDDPITFDWIYLWFTNTGYVFVRYYISADTLSKLLFVAPICADCTLQGTLTKPDFWIDLD